MGCVGCGVCCACVIGFFCGEGCQNSHRPHENTKTKNSLPVTVKIRTGVQESKINAEYVTRLLGAAGAAAVAIHGRTMEQRYKKAADWGLIADVAERTGVPVIGASLLLLLLWDLCNTSNKHTRATLKKIRQRRHLDALRGGRPLGRRARRADGHDGRARRARQAVAV